MLLDAKAYTSEQWFEEEQEKIFGNNWQFAGLVEDVEEAGDYITAQCGHQNILVIKDNENQLKAFHNLCRHRGTQLLRAVGKVKKALTCPYHDWTYNLNGQLISAPEKEKEFPDLDLNTICLHKASVGVWRGMIWVHPKPNQAPVSEIFKNFEPYLGPHQPERLIEYDNTRYERVIQANWKIVVENYIDVYHLSHLHSNTLNMYDHKQAQFGFEGDHYWFKEPLSKKYEQNLEKLIPYKRIQEVCDEKLQIHVPWLFPNLGLAETEESWSTFHITPLSPSETKVVVRTKIESITEEEYKRQTERSYYYWGELMGYKSKYNSDDANDPMSTGDFMEEDIYACEQQQKSMKNPFLRLEHSAKYGESSILGFQKILNRWMEK